MIFPINASPNFTLSLFFLRSEPFCWNEGIFEKKNYENDKFFKCPRVSLNFIFTNFHQIHISSERRILRVFFPLNPASFTLGHPDPEKNCLVFFRIKQHGSSSKNSNGVTFLGQKDPDWKNSSRVNSSSIYIFQLTFWIHYCKMTFWRVTGIQAWQLSMPRVKFDFANVDTGLYANFGNECIERLATVIELRWIRYCITFHG